MANQIKYFGGTDLYNLLVLLKGEYDKYVLAVQGKGLSTNDFTDALLSKLNGIETGAEENVQSDWNEADSTSDAFIKNKPTIPAAQVNSDWNAASGVAQILNKPTLGTAATKDVPASGDAGATQVVMGSDSRLTDARPASNVTDTYSATGTAPVSGKAVAQALATITGIRFVSYPSFADLPAVGEDGVIYLIPNGGSAPNVKDEYFWNSATNAYEKFGTTDVDLTDYLKDTDVVEMTQAEVQAVWDRVFGSGS